MVSSNGVAKMNSSIDYVQWERDLKSTAYGQAHLFSPTTSKSVDKIKLINQLVDLDSKIPGGLKGYVERSKKLMIESKNNLNPLDAYYVGKNDGVGVDLSGKHGPGTKGFDDLEA